MQDPSYSEATFVEFLESTPPNTWVKLVEARETVSNVGKDARWSVELPEIQLHCGASACNGVRIFKPKMPNGTDYLPLQKSVESYFLRYQCRNCNDSTKHFAVLRQLRDDNRVLLHKTGEYPAFGPPIPARAISLVGPDRELFLRGRRCENQGLGVGAFAYYRRVVDHQWRRLLEEIIRVAHVVGSPAETIKALEDAVQKPSSRRR
jgi:hypothetical protein